MAIRERLLSPQSSSRPKQEHQNNRPNNTPADPCDVRVSRLPFENLLMNGHQECPSFSSTGILQIVASFCQIFSAAAAMPVTRRRKDHYRKFSSSCIGGRGGAKPRALSRCQIEHETNRLARRVHAAATTSRHVRTADALKARCVLADVR
jgi:hypothetical protein